MITLGERVKRKFTGKVYRVGRIMEDWILLEEEGGISQVLTGRKNLELFFTRIIKTPIIHCSYSLGREEEVVR